MNAVIYCRVSSDQQVKDGHGLQGQESRCREYAQRNGYKVSRVYQDKGVTGGTIDRPALQQMFVDLRKKKNIDLVLFEDVNRIARDMGVHLEVISTITKLGADVQTVNQPIEHTAVGKFILQSLANNAELERNLNRDRVTNKMSSRLKSGYWTFDNPPGYKYQKVSGHGKLLVPDEPKASIIKTALEGFANNRFESQVDVQRFLESKNFKHRGSSTIVHLEQVKRILTRVLYTGYIKYDKWGIPLLKGHHEPLISIDTYNKIQEKLNGSVKKYRRTNTLQDFPLRGFVLCGDCNHLLTAQWSKGRNKLHPYYRCNHKECNEYGKSIKRSELNESFKKLLKEIKPDTGVLNLTKEVLIDIWQNKTTEVQEMVRKKKQEQSEMNEKISIYLERIGTTKDLDLIEMYEQKIKDLKSKKLLLGSNLDLDNCLTEKDFRTALDRVFSFIKNPPKMWENGDLAQKQLVLKLVFKGSLSYCRKTGFRTACLSLPVAISNTKNTQYNSMVEMVGANVNQIIEQVMYMNELLNNTKSIELSN